MKLVILDGYAENPGDLSWDGLSKLVDEYTVYDITAPEDIIKRSLDADILVTNKTPVTRQTIEKLPKLKFIAVLATGFNVVDCKAARERGIPVSNIPAYSTDSVAQLVFGFMLEFSNRVALHSESVKNGDWEKSEHFCYLKAPLSLLSGKTLGIVGFGRIGFAVAEIANAFKMRVLAFSPHTNTYDGFGKVEFCSFERLVAESDFVTLHCPLTESTSGMVNKAFLEKMKKTAYLINTSRGGVVNENDLAEALENGTIAGAGLDVLSAEPPKGGNVLIGAKNCLITPHIAWASLEARTKLLNIFLENVESFVKGTPVNVVN
ncbi:MAG: D-2-hydroxyacid dehydrogenase [Oscillospiraceae bacterium]|nr:D-2-hydroxyacid dehydrogenase [Oscillospiraceae bacterium]MDD7293309.1 D-2-hydroxyacid dehydrogenase [Clostridiaceae bacterium]